MTTISPWLLLLWDALGWAMLHFFWAGALVALLARVVLWAIRPRSPQLRYAAALAAFLLLALTPALVLGRKMANGAAATGQRPTTAINETEETRHQTQGQVFENWAAFRVRPTPRDDGRETLAQEIATSTKGPLPRSESVAAIPVAEELRRVIDQGYAFAQGMLPWLWLCGFPLACAWILIGATGAERLRRGCRPLENEEWIAICRRLKQQLGLRARVKFGVYDGLAVPVLIGIIR